MSNLPAWKNVISGGLLPNGSPLYYYSPAPSFGGGGSGSVSYADSAGTALTASYVNIKGSGITVNYFGSQIQLTGSGGSGSSSESASYASTASYALYAVSASYEIIQELSSSYAESASYSAYATYAALAENAVSSSYSPYAATASYVLLTYGPGISYDPSKPMAFSASLRSVNGVYPTNGNVATSLAGVETGTSQSLYLSSSGDITASLNEGAVWVISNDPTSSNNGKSFIYDVDDAGVGSWYELSSLDLALTDARYLKLDAVNGPMQGNLDMGGFNITTGNLVGTSSWAEKAISSISSSYVNITGSNIIVNYAGSQIQLTGSGDATVIISASIPGEKKAGSLWFNSNDGNTYIQYIDPTGSTWIPAATSVGNAFSSSYASTALSASRAITASHALTASFLLGTVASASFAVTASYLNGTVPTVIHAQNSSGQSIPNNVSSPTTIVTNWTNILAQNASEWNPATGIFTAAKAGVYSVSAALTYAAKSAPAFGNQVNVIIGKNRGYQAVSANFAETGNSVVEELYLLLLVYP